VAEYAYNGPAARVAQLVEHFTCNAPLAMLRKTA